MPNKIGDQLWNPFEMPLRKTEFRCDVSALGAAISANPRRKYVKYSGASPGDQPRREPITGILAVAHQP